MRKDGSELSLLRFNTSPALSMQAQHRRGRWTTRSEHRQCRTLGLIASPSSARAYTIARCAADLVPAIGPRTLVALVIESGQRSDWMLIGSESGGPERLNP